FECVIKEGLNGLAVFAQRILPGIAWVSRITQECGSCLRRKSLDPFTLLLSQYIARRASRVGGPRRLGANKSGVQLLRQIGETFAQRPLHDDCMHDRKYSGAPIIVDFSDRRFLE